MNSVVIGLVAVCVLIIGVWLRERSWNHLLSQKLAEIDEKNAQLDNAFNLLRIEKQVNEQSSFIIFAFAQRCLQRENKDESVIISEVGPPQILATKQEVLLEIQLCYQQLLYEVNLTAANTTVETTNSSISITKLSIISQSKIFDWTGLSMLLALTALFLSELLLVYNISKSAFDFEGITYEKSDFLEKPLYHQLELFLIKDHPISLFFTFTFLGGFTFLIYLFSWFVNWSNGFYYLLLHRVIQLLVVIPVANFLSFLVFNSITIHSFLRKLYSKSIVQIVFEQYHRVDFWVLLGKKLFLVYDLQSFLAVLIWLVAQSLFFLPLLLIYYYHDSFYVHTALDSYRMNTCNSFLLAAILHATIPFCFMYYCVMVTVILPFLSSQSVLDLIAKKTPVVGLHEQIIFNDRKTLLRRVLDYLIAINFFFSRDNSLHLDEKEQKTLKSNDMKMGLIFFLCAGNSLVFFFRFLYSMLLSQLTVTWCGWFTNWSFVAFHVFLLLLTLPTINVLLYKYEIIRKYRNPFREQVEEKLKESAEEQVKNSGNSESNIMNVEDELRVALELFDFALHKAVLYCLFIRDVDESKEENTDKDSQRDIAQRLERTFSSFLQSDSFAFATKFSQRSKRANGDDSGDEKY